MSKTKCSLYGPITESEKAAIRSRHAKTKPTTTWCVGTVGDVHYLRSRDARNPDTIYDQAQQRKVKK